MAKYLNTPKLQEPRYKRRVRYKRRRCPVDRLDEAQWRIEISAQGAESDDAQQALVQWHFRRAAGAWRAWFHDREIVVRAVAALKRAGLHGRAIRIKVPPPESPSTPVPTKPHVPSGYETALPPPANPPLGVRRDPISGKLDMSHYCETSTGQ